jgi:hypothetical protein
MKFKLLKKKKSLKLFFKFNLKNKIKFINFIKSINI